MEIIIHQAILHVLDTTLDAPVLSGGGMELTAEKTAIAHLTYVGDTDCGSGVNFGCGVAIANFNGKEKFRTTIGDGAFLGCNTNLVAPVTIGAGAYTAAGATVTRDVPEDAMLIARAEQTVKPGLARRFRREKK